MENCSCTKPLFYCRYVDDTYLVFENRSQMVEFFKFMNEQCECIKFTKEEEHSNQLPFLDVLVKRNSEGKISTTLYRKPTFSGLYLRWDSFVPKQYKRGLINCLIHRAWKICSSYEQFHLEVKFIQSTLIANGYPVNFIERCVNKYLSKFYSPKESKDPVFGPEKKNVFMKLPYLGHESIKIQRQLERLVSCVAPWVKLRVLFTPAYKLSSLSKLKCTFPLTMLSNVVYKIKCAECS